MGTVIEHRMSGDNDPPITPEPYDMYYKYCDHCGSFDIHHWTEPENHEQLAKIQSRLNWLAIGAFVASLISLFIAMAGYPIFLALSVLTFIGAGVAAGRIGSRIQMRGVYCGQCQTRYAYGSDFFSDTEANPRGYTMADVPRPLNQNYQMPSRTLRT